MPNKRSGALTQFNKLLDELCELMKEQAIFELNYSHNSIYLSNREFELKMEIRQLVRTMK